MDGEKKVKGVIFTIQNEKARGSNLGRAKKARVLLNPLSSRLTRVGANKSVGK